ncbi:hypothetical protein JTB14_011606 [Gonioctena quinquepunctata]|nr:hypothetical protein JTB14_011606 [Gonioctena quinquepunctata]
MEKKLYCSQQQKQQLIEMVTRDKELLSGKFSNSFTKEDCMEKWETIAQVLNSMPGASKQWMQWKKTWQDMKCTTKKKHVIIKNHMQGTGGGPPIVDILTPNGELVLESMNPTSVSGNTEIPETEILFNWEKEIANVSSVDELISVARTPSPKLDHTYMKENKKRKRFTPARRRALAANATQVLAQNSERDLEIRERYYTKKTELMERQTVALEKIANHICNK